MNSLTETYKSGNYATDKYVLGYLEHIYDHIFTDRYAVTKLLEIGIKEGGSLRLWRDWFVNAQIQGVDITPCPALQGETRIITYNQDAYSDGFLDSLESEYDVIIDDGPHTFESMIFFVSKYVHKIKPGGLLVLEDIIDPTWTPEILSQVPDDCAKNVYHMENKQVSDHLSREWSNQLETLGSLFRWSKSRPMLHRLVKALDMLYIGNRLRYSVNLSRHQRRWSQGLDVAVVKKPERERLA